MRPGKVEGRVAGGLPAIVGSVLPLELKYFYNKKGLKKTKLNKMLDALKDGYPIDASDL